MTERPILFSAPMVRALLAGTKTQTRRVVTLRGAEAIEERSWQNFFLQSPWPWSPEADAWVPCPYGAPGDRLWVRETWGLPPRYDPKEHGDLKTKPRLGPVCFAADYTAADGTSIHAWEGGKWRPSIHMPRWASRLTLEVTGVRVERLQDISEEDARAEGARRFDDLPSTHPYGQDARWSCAEPKSTNECLGTARMAFGNLWNSINGADSWAANPWVWVVSFKRVTP